MTADMPQTLDDYRAALAPEQRARHDALLGAVATRAASAPRVHSLLFVPGRRHPEFADSETVLWRAIQQLMMTEQAAEGELPLAWIGYDVASRFSGKREAQGFLITDRRLIVKDQVDGVFGTAEPRQYPLFVNQAGVAGSAAELAETATASYDWEFPKKLLDAGTAQSMSQLLGELLVAVLETLGRLGTALAPAPATAAGLRGRVNELGLGDAAKYPDDAKQAKHFVKIAKKFPLESGERILLALTGATLAGVYGLLLTDRGVRSKDLGKDPVFTATTGIDVAGVRISAENAHQLILAPGEVHELPATLDERGAAAVATLMREWAEGRLQADAD